MKIEFKSVVSVVLMFLVITMFSLRWPQTISTPSHELWLLSFKPELTRYEEMRVRLIYLLNPDMNYSRELYRGEDPIRVSTIDNAQKIDGSYILKMYKQRSEESIKK